MRGFSKVFRVLFGVCVVLATRLRPFIGGLSNYDLTPDGKRLAAILASDEAQTHLTVLFNFFDELRRRVPVGK